jgi:hypothetical protein
MRSEHPVQYVIVHKVDRLARNQPSKKRLADPIGRSPLPRLLRSRNYLGKVIIKDAE